MNKIVDFMEEKVMPIADKVSNNRYLLAIRDGFMLVMPLLIIGAMALLVANFPVPGYSELMSNIFGSNWSQSFTVTFDVTMAIMTIFVIIGVSYSLAAYYEIEGISTAAISLVAFFLVTPFKVNGTIEGIEGTVTLGGGIPMEWIGTKGLFVGMFVAIVATEIIRFVNKKNWVIKMPAGVPPTVAKAFSSLIPFLVVIITFNIIRVLFTVTSFETIHNFVYKILQTPLMSLGDSLGGVLVANSFSGILWSFGIHGGSIVESVMNPIWIALSAENLQAFNAGAELPHIVTQQFQQIFLQLGGSGSTLALCAMMVFTCKSQQCKKLGKLAIVPGVFNINEPIIFGLPIVLNPLMIIPFVITPLVLGVICYVSISTGLVPAPSGVLIPWTTPPVIGGFLISGVRGALLQVGCLLVSGCIYFPFLKAVDKQCCEKELLG